MAINPNKMAKVMLEYLFHIIDQEEILIEDVKEAQ